MNPRPTDPRQAATPAPSSAQTRPWIGVQFTCANRYVRVHRRVDGSGYLARCPACGREVRFRVGEGGSDARFFEVSC